MFTIDTIFLDTGVENELNTLVFVTRGLGSLGCGLGLAVVFRLVDWNSDELQEFYSGKMSLVEQVEIDFGFLPSYEVRILGF